MQGRHKKIKIALSENDFMDYVLLGSLVSVAIFGLFMFKKVREQQKVLL